VFNFPLELILILEDVFESTVLFDGVFLADCFEKLVLLGDDIFDCFRLEALVHLALEEMSSEFLGMLFELVLVFFYFSH
jgi:hypothetical protein